MLTDLDALRSSIDNFDLAIVCMFTERFRATRRIGEIKALAGMSATDQQREDLQLQRLKKAAAASEKDSDRERLMAMTKVTFDDIWSADGTTQPEHVADTSSECLSNWTLPPCVLVPSSSSAAISPEALRVDFRFEGRPAFGRWGHDCRHGETIR